MTIGDTKLSLDDFLNEKDIKPRICLQCNKPFVMSWIQERKKEDSPSRQKFCSTKCRRKHYEKTDKKNVSPLIRQRMATLLNKNYPLIYKELYLIAKKEYGVD